MAESAASRSGGSDENLEATVKFVRSRAAFISLKKMELRKAQELFIKSRVDPREIISLFPRMLPASSNFTRSLPPLHDIPDIHSVSHIHSVRIAILHKSVPNKSGDLARLGQLGNPAECRHQSGLQTFPSYLLVFVRRKRKLCSFHLKQKKQSSEMQF